MLKVFFRPSKTLLKSNILLIKLYNQQSYISRARKCKSFEETFYKPESKCFPMEDPSGGPCPETQILFDGDHNEGVCLCKEFGLVFNKEFEFCYRLNTQVTSAFYQ